MKTKGFFKTFLASSVALAMVQTATAQDADDESASRGGLNLEEVIVTGSPRGISKMDSSLSVTTVSAERAESFVPTGTVDVLKSIPGIRVESTGGDSNGNITVRGVPLGGGGSRFVQIHEDGLPVLQYGDIIVANADNYFTYDQTVKRVEAIKGGTSATLASHSPSGVINFVSKTGEEEGGVIVYKTGLDHDTNRVDFAYGQPVGDDWAFHVGGFYRVGEGVRETDFTAEDGGQIKLSVSRIFENGKVRIYGKVLDDKTATILPMPVLTNNEAVPGLDPRTASNIPVGLLNNRTTDGSGGFRESSIGDGSSVSSQVLGGEIQFDLAEDLFLTQKFRAARNSGKFFGAFTFFIGDATDVDSIGVPNPDGLTLGYANGPGSGVALSDAELSSLNGNGLIQDIRTFDNDIHSVDNFTNDISLTKTFETDSGSTDVTLGYYIATQEADIDWFWQSHIADVQDIPRLMDLYDDEGNRLTSNGQIAFGAPQWGNCCTRDTYFDSDVEAIYLAVNSDITEDLSVNLSVRQDSGDTRGSWIQANASVVDIDNNGEISFAENIVETFDAASRANPNTALFSYDWDYTSYALGFNYIINDGFAVFGNYSSGGRAGFGDRLADGGYIIQGQAQPGAVENDLSMLEGGVKYQGDNWGVFATVFYAETEDANAESARGLDIATRIREYEAQGIEIETTANFGDFSFFGGLTYTDSEIVGADDENVIGQTPRRQPDLIFSGTLTYHFNENSNAGISMWGRSDSFVGDDNDSARELDGYTTFNAFVSYGITEDLTARIAVNNLTDEIGITEAEGFAWDANGFNVTAARGILGRSTSLELRYDF